MLTSAGSTLDSSCTSAAKLSGRDWPGLALGVLVTLESALGVEIFPAWIDIGSGKYADDLGINLWGLGLCTAGYLAGAVIGRIRARAGAENL